jgi:beta-galactosidase
VDKIRPAQRLKFAACFIVVVVAIFLLPGLLCAQTAPPPPIMMGTAWYPEQWPESRWDADLTLMQQAGIHMVRIGEFSWSSMEPAKVNTISSGWKGRSLLLRNTASTA